jgi:hypothetical protein
MQNFRTVYKIKTERIGRFFGDIRAAEGAGHYGNIYRLPRILSMTSTAGGGLQYRLPIPLFSPPHPTPPHPPTVYILKRIHSPISLHGLMLN